MRRILFILTNIICLLHGTHAADAGSPPQASPLTVSQVYTAINGGSSTVIDQDGIPWKVQSTLSLSPQDIAFWGSIPLPLMNSIPVIVSPETLRNFFSQLSQQSPSSEDLLLIGLKFLIPVAMQPPMSDHYVYLTREVPKLDSAQYPTNPNFSELDAVYRHELSRLLTTQEQTRADFFQAALRRIREVAFVSFFMGAVTTISIYTIPTWILVLCAYPTMMSLAKLFLETGILARNLWD